MNFPIEDSKERIPDEEDIYGVNDSVENEYDYEVWMPYEEGLRRRKNRLRILTLVVIVAFALAFAFAEFRSLFGW